MGGTALFFIVSISLAIFLWPIPPEKQFDKLVAKWKREVPKVCKFENFSYEVNKNAHPMTAKVKVDLYLKYEFYYQYNGRWECVDFRLLTFYILSDLVPKEEREGGDKGLKLMSLGKWPEEN